MMEWTFTLTRQDGRSLLLGRDPIRLVSAEGTENGSYTLSTAENAQIPGAVVTGQKLPPRQLELSGDLDYTRREELRREMMAFFAPDQPGVAVVRRGDTERKIAYRVSALTFRQKQLCAPAEFTLRLYCPNPYWENVSDYGKNLAAAVPLIGFPLILPDGAQPHGRGSRRFLTGYTTTNRTAYLGNGGDAPAGIRAELTATRGQVVNPSLTLLDTGQRVRVLVTMAKGDRLELSTVPRQKTVTLNGENAFHLVDRDSEFFSVPVGGGRLEYDAQDGYTNLDLRLFYTPVYLGI